MARDYSKHRLTDYFWQSFWERKLGKEEFDRYKNKVYAFLIRMPEGTKRDIDHLCKEETRDLFIKLVCQYIDEGNTNVQFSEDYTEIKKIRE